MRALAVLVVAALLAGCASSGPSAPRQDRAAEDRAEDVDTLEDASEETGDPAGPPSESPTSTGPAPGSGSTSPPAPTPPSPAPPPPPPPPASPPRAWASPEQAAIRPGASLDNGSCTANFIFTSPDNATVYIGTAAHCFKTSANPQAIPGCEAGTEALGATMDVDGAASPGVLVYSSWITMQAVGETDPDTCRYNDFALLQLAPGDYATVSPAMKQFGGPTRLADPGEVQSLDKVLTFGNSGTRVFTDGPTSPKEGYVSARPSNGWSANIYTVTLGVPGDSGSGVILGTGEAMGDLVTLAATGENGVTMLAPALEYARQHDFEVRLATWDLLDSGLLPEI